MKRILLLFMTMILMLSCNHSSGGDVNMDPAVKRKILKKQIDSLKRELVKVEKQLRDTVTAEDLPVVTVDTMKQVVFKHYIDIQGNVKSDGNINVVPEFAGEVLKIYKKPGDRVRKGELIMKIDDKLLRDQIAEVRTQYALAQTAYERQKRLWNQKIGSEMAYLQAKAKRDGLLRKLRTLRTQLSKAKVTAPISGTVDDIMIKEGEMAGPGRPVARIVNLDKVYVEADVSEKYLKEITKGKPVILYFPELDTTLQAKVDYTGNFIHPNNRTFKIRVYLKNKDNLFKPNLTGQIKVLDYQKDKTLVLPLSLVQEDNEGKNFVFVLEPDQDVSQVFTVKKRYVETGLNYNGKVEILSGLQPGDVIIVSGARGLTEGDRVRIQQGTEE